MPTRLMMASILDTHTKSQQHDIREDIVAVVDTQEFYEAPVIRVSAPLWRRLTPTSLTSSDTLETASRPAATAATGA